MIIFRTDANPIMGFGHLTRCRALAQALLKRGVKSILIGPEKKYASKNDAEVFYQWLPLEWISSQCDAKALVDYSKQYAARVVVIDDYRVDEQYQLFLKSNDIKWLQFEVRTEKPIYADIVINANPLATRDTYKNKRNPASKFLMGPKYAVLREDFHLSKYEVLSKKYSKKILIALGGGDDRGALLTILANVISEIPTDWNVTVISGENNPRHDMNIKWIDENTDNVQYHINPPNLVELIKECQFSITSGGSFTYEMASLGIPMIIYALSDDQYRSIAWEKKQCGYFIGDINENHSEKFSLTFKKLIYDEKLRNTFKENCRKLCDGYGAARVAGELKTRIKHT